MITIGFIIATLGIICGNGYSINENNDMFIQIYLLLDEILDIIGNLIKITNTMLKNRNETFTSDISISNGSTLKETPGKEISTNPTFEYLETTTAIKNRITTTAIENLETITMTENLETTTMTENFETTTMTENLETTTMTGNLETTTMTGNLETTTMTENLETTTVTKNQEPTTLTENLETENATENLETTSVTKSTETTGVTENTETTSVTENTETTSVTENTETESAAKNLETESATENLQPGSVTESLDTRSATKTETRKRRQINNTPRSFKKIHSILIHVKYIISKIDAGEIFKDDLNELREILQELKEIKFELKKNETEKNYANIIDLNQKLKNIYMEIDNSKTNYFSDNKIDYHLLSKSKTSDDKEEERADNDKTYFSERWNLLIIVVVSSIFTTSFVILSVALVIKWRKAKTFSKSLELFITGQLFYSDKNIHQGFDKRERQYPEITEHTLPRQWSNPLATNVYYEDDSYDTYNRWNEDSFQSTDEITAERSVSGLKRF